MTPYGDTDMDDIGSGCLTAPSHYLNQCRLLMGEVLRHLDESNFRVIVQATNLYESVKIIYIQNCYRISHKPVD